MSRQEIVDQLIGPDGFFPVEPGVVRGHDVPVFVNRRRSLREFVEGAATHGDADFLVLGDRRISHRQFHDLVAAEAANLAVDHGIGKGDRVGILAANSPDWVIAYFAIVSLGGVVCLYNGWWTAEEIRHGTELSAPGLILGDAKRLARVSADLDVELVDMIAERNRLQRDAGRHELPTVEIDEDDPCSIFFTSGTTGRSKGATVSHRGLVGFVDVQMLSGAIKYMLAAAEASERGEEAPAPPSGAPVVLMTSPLFHVSGLSGATLINMVVGGTLVFREGRFDVEDCFRLVEDQGVTVWTLIGAMGPRAVSHPKLDDYDLSSLTQVGFGGAPASPELQQRAREAFPTATANVAIGYGSSESVCAIAFLGGAEYEANPTSTGYVYPTMALEIRDEQGQRVPDGSNGQVWVRSAYTMLGYWDDPEATAATIDDEFWLDTGDIGRLEHGLLYLDSRARDMILHNGENVYPVEIEYRLDEHPAVQESAVYGVEDDETGQLVAASVVPQPGATVTESELTAWAAEALAPYKVPTAWDIRRDPLPRNAGGKIVKGALSGEREFHAHDD